MNFNQHVYNGNQFNIVEICINMKYVTLLTFDRKVCIYLIAKVKRFKLKEGICNTRLIQELQYVWQDKIMLRGQDLKYRILERTSINDELHMYEL